MTKGQLSYYVVYYMEYVLLKDALDKIHTRDPVLPCSIAPKPSELFLTNIDKPCTHVRLKNDKMTS